jgi:hypothetical protein
MRQMNKKLVILLIAFLLILTLPYIVSYLLTGNGYHFNGFLVNPIDGHSYLAKMQIGRSGEWLFRLPYTSQRGDGVFLFTYYIVLGHIAALLSLPNIIVFHIARIVNSLFLFFVLTKYVSIYINEKWSLFSIGLLSFGSGLGWFVLLFGYVNSDFTIPEIYPFLSCLTNPHFPLAMGLMLIILERIRDLRFVNSIKTALISLILLIVQPFCMVIVAGVLSISLLLALRENLREKIIQLFVLSIPSLAFGLYLTMIIKNNPALSSWNSQNLTPSPPIWDLLLALSPIIVPAVYSIVFIIKSREKIYYPIVIWVLFVLLLAYIPLNLQRRFLIGLYIPVAILGIKGITVFVEKLRGKVGKIKNLLLSAAIPSNIILIFLSISAVALSNQNLVMKNSLWDGLQWVSMSTPAKSLILTTPFIGLYVPAYTNDRVIYGHPYETANAEVNQSNVEAFFSKMRPEEKQKYLTNEGVDYILTASENNTEPLSYSGMNLNVVYQVEDVKIYLVKK